MTRLEIARARARMYETLRGWFRAHGYDEVETPLLVPAPGMEPHINPFQTDFVPETDVGRRMPLWLQTSPEFAMKRLLADGAGPVFQLCKVFRNGEVSPTHNPEFTMLEFYRPNADYAAIIDDTEAALSALSPDGERAGVRGALEAPPSEAISQRSSVPAPHPDPLRVWGEGTTRHVFARTPYERLTVRDAVLDRTGVDIKTANTAEKLAAECARIGVRASGDTFDDVFFHLFLQRVEPTLGHGRPTFLTEYPASMAALARLKPGDSTVAERVELYVNGLELGNGFSELTDAAEQRRRFEEEQALRRRLGRPQLPLDERFLSALPKMPPSAGIAIGLDRVLMLVLGKSRIEEVLLFPAHEFVR